MVLLYTISRCTDNSINIILKQHFILDGIAAIVLAEVVIAIAKKKRGQAPR
jgi:hypothetical protein